VPAPLKATAIRHLAYQPAIQHAARGAFVAAKRKTLVRLRDVTLHSDAPPVREESMATAALNRYTPEEYLALERNAEFKSEYIDGRIIAMTPGAARPHILVVSALVREIDPRTLDRSCEVYSNDMRVKVSASGDYVYPDVVVACDPQFEDEAFDTLLNPVLIIEVLSDSTERHDRGVKFSLYRRIESLQEYVLLSQKEMLAERYVRRGDFWQFSSIDGLDAALELASIDVQIPLERIYSQALTPTRRVPRSEDSAE
jgi:Uma2 family endonuclease